MGGIRFCWYGYGCQLENPFVCFGAKPTQRACAGDFPRDRKRTREGRFQGQEKEAVKRKQITPVDRREQGSQQKRAGARPWTQGWLANVRR